MLYEHVEVRQGAQRPLVATRQRAEGADDLDRPPFEEAAPIASSGRRRGVLRLQSMSLYGGEDGDRVAFF